MCYYLDNIIILGNIVNMATINLKTWLTSNRFTTASYDDVTGIISLEIDPALPRDEEVIKNMIFGIEESCNGKRTNLNSPISEKSFPDNPKFNFVNRENADASLTELQIEYNPQIVLWLKSVDILTAEAVNDND
jgi:hypothetical protein